MVKKTVSKKSSKVTYVITATFSYGPFKTKSDAEAMRARLSSLNGAVTTSVKKGARGYTFQSKTHIGATNAAMKTQAIATIHKHAPSAKVAIRKA